MPERSRQNPRQMQPLFLKLASFLLLTNHAYGFGWTSVACDPAIVGTHRSSLTVEVMTENFFKSGGKIQIKVPKQATVVDGGHLCTLFSEFQQAENVSCSADAKSNTLTFPLNFNLPQYQPVKITFKNSFNVPLTTEKTDSFIFTVTSSDGLIVESQDTDILFESDLEVASLPPASLLQVDSTRVGDITQAYFTVTTFNPIPPGGGLQVALPKWNPLANSVFRESFIVLPEDYEAAKEQMSETRRLQSGVKLCANKKGIDDGAYCFLETTLSEDYLTLIDAFPDGVAAGGTFSFYVYYIRNPISASPVGLTLTTYSGIAEKIEDEVIFKGLIDQGTTTLQAKEGVLQNPANSQISALITTVQEYSTFFVPFSVPVPVQKGCRLLIKLPADFQVTEGMISLVQGWGIFNSNNGILRAEVDAQAGTIKISDQCNDYSAANLKSTIQIKQLKNPTYVLQTQSFQISLLDSQANVISNMKSDVFYTPTAGTIKDVSLVPLNGEEIQTMSNIVLTFTPPHAIKGASRITVKMPDKIEFSCILAYTTNLKAAPACTQLKPNVFQFDSPFLADTFPGNQPVSIAFRNRELPASVEPIKGIDIATYQIVDGKPFLVDQLIAPDMELFQMKAVQFFSATVKSDSYVTYSNTGLTFQMTVASTIPADGLVRIYFPEEVTVPNFEAAAKACVMPSFPDRSIKCTFSVETMIIINLQGQEQEVDLTLLEVESVFGDDGLRASDDFLIQITTGVTTPISLKTSGTFVVQVLDRQRHLINFIQTALTLTMSQGINIGPLDFQSDSYSVGAQTMHTLSFTTPIPLEERNRIYIMIPPEVGVPLPGQFTVTSSTPEFAKNFAYSIIGNKVTIVVKLATKIDANVALPTNEENQGRRRVLRSATTGVIPQKTKLTFKFGPVKNPQSMASSSPYKIEIDSPDLYVEAVQTTQGAKVRCKNPSEITNFDFTAADLRQGALTTITISWQNTQYYPQDLSLKISFDQDEIFPKLPVGQVSTDCFFRNQRFVECLFFEDYIQIKNMLSSPQNAGQPMSITITSMIINVFKNGPTKSWKLATFTGSDEIDEIKEGLSFNFLCNFPCNACGEDPDECNSCNDYDSGSYLILYENKCYSTCPDGTYEESFQCKLCNPKCKTCGNGNSQWCTSCDVDSEFPFLDGSTCADECSFGKFGNIATGQCEPCEKPCESCVGDAGTCLSCFQNTEEKYLGHNQCLTKCPSKTVADVTKKSTICEDCSSNCFDCIGTPTTCSACPTDFFLNMVDNVNNCVETCPKSTSVTNTKKQICEPCDFNCLTCSQDTKQCTSCRPLFNLNDGICTLECDTKEFKQVPLDGVCVDCDPSCKTCQGTKTNCLSCWEGFHWYVTKCVDECPLIEGYQYKPNKNTNKCEIDGIKCKFGYKVSDAGNFCELALSVCEPPTTLNYDQTKCIPGADDWVPFPIWILWIAPTFLILLISKLKARETKFVSNLIVFLSIAEIAAMIYVAYLAKVFGILPVTALVSFSIAMHFGINLFFLLVFTKQVRNDTALTHWCQYNKKITTTITIIGTLFNFKAYRLFFSRLFGRDEFHAPMESPIIFYAPFNLSSVINMVLVKLVVMFGCAFGIFYVSWGYQLLVECLELLAIELLIIVLNVVEYLQMKKSGIMETKQYSKINPKRVERANVMGGNFSDEDDNSDPFVVDPKTKERRAQPKSMKNISKLERILVDYDLNEQKRVYGQTMADEDPDEMEVMRRHHRHCVSFKGLPTKLPDAWLSDASDDNCHQNFISEPNSPCSKQMLHNSQFISRMLDLRDAYRDGNLGDNVYTDSYDPNLRPMRSTKVVSVKVQTNVMELLGLDDLQQPREQASEVSDQSSRYIEDEFDENATRKLISNVIGNIDSDNDSDEVKRQRKRWPTDAGKAQCKKRKLTKKRLAEIPNFAPEEILGEFMKDENGSNLMVRSRAGKLNDKFGRLVNRRGYLVSKTGNVLTRGDVFIFRSDEVNDDDEIPAPYCLNKAYQMNDFRVMDYADFKKFQKKQKFAMQDQYIEKEYQRLKQESELAQFRKKAQNLEARTLEPYGDSGMFRVDSEGLQTEEILKSSIEEDLSDVLQPIVPKTKKELLGLSSFSTVGNNRLLSEQGFIRGMKSGEIDMMNHTSSDGRAKSRGSQKSLGSGSKKRRSNSGKRSGRDGRVSTGDEQNATGFDLSNQLIHMRSDSNSLRESHMEAAELQRNDQVLIDLKFEKTKSKKKKKSKAKSKVKPHARVEDQHRFSTPVNVYAENQRKIDATRDEIRQDEQFIAKLTKFTRHANNQQPSGNLAFPLLPMDVYHDDSKMALRHQNLGAIYGRVKQKFNHQIRAGGASLKFGPNNTEILGQIGFMETYQQQKDKDALGRLKAKQQKLNGSSKMNEIQKIYQSGRPASSHERSSLQQSKSRPRVESSGGQGNRSQTSQAVLFHDMVAKETTKDAKERAKKKNADIMIGSSDGQTDIMIGLDPSSHVISTRAKRDGAFDILHGKFI